MKSAQCENQLLRPQLGQQRFKIFFFFYTLVPAEQNSWEEGGTDHGVSCLTWHFWDLFSPFVSTLCCLVLVEQCSGINYLQRRVPVRKNTIFESFLFATFSFLSLFLSVTPFSFKDEKVLIRETCSSVFWPNITLKLGTSWNIAGVSLLLSCLELKKISC